jgi:ribosome maturation factor RimP
VSLAYSRGTANGSDGFVMTNESDIRKFADQILKELRLELVELDLFQAGHRQILRLFIDKEEGVSVEDCAEVSRKLGALLDLEDIMESAYTLEVSSPGIDRPLQSVRDYNRNVGRMLRLSFVEKVEDKNLILARLDEVLENGILVDWEGKRLELDFANIMHAKVEVQF